MVKRKIIQKNIHIGVLALQGDFSKHREMILSLGHSASEVRCPKDLDVCDALILPGGESTTLNMLLDVCHLREPILTFSQNKPILGTCAGAILLAKNTCDFRMKPLGIIDIEIQRNAYGRQIDSFSQEISIPCLTSSLYDAVFIRAPQILSAEKNVEILAKCNDDIVFVRQKNIFALTFHPELTTDTRIHEYFLKSCVSS